MHILPRLNSFINEIAPFTASMRQEGAILKIVIKQELYAYGPEPLRDFYRVFNMAKVKYQLEDFVAPEITVLKTSMNIHVSDEVEFFIRVDTVGLVTQTLRSFFHREETGVISEGLAFLKQLGLSDDKLESELGVSKTTIWRYQNKCKKDKAVSM